MVELQHLYNLYMLKQSKKDTFQLGTYLILYCTLPRNNLRTLAKPLSLEQDPSFPPPPHVHFTLHFILRQTSIPLLCQILELG